MNRKQVKDLVGFDTYNMMITDIEKELAKEPQEDAFDRLMKIKNKARDKYLKKVKNAEMEY